MKSASTKLLFFVSGAAILLAGCAKKPARPDPRATVLGQEGNGSSTTINPQNGGETISPDLQARNGDLAWDQNNQVRGLLAPIYFDFDSSSIKAGERAKAQAAKDFLDKHPGVHILLEGHCDWRGTAEYNLALGDRRANEVKKYLAGLGVGADSLDTLSKGSEDAQKNADKDAMGKDRRVEFVVIKAPGDAAPADQAPAAGAPAGAPAASGPTGS